MPNPTMPSGIRSRPGLRGAVVAALALVAVIIWSAAAPAQQGDNGPPATPVGVAEVGEVSARQTVPVVGRLVARQAGPVAAQVAGAVKEFLVEVGDAVEAGAMLVRLDTERASLDLALASGEVQQRIAQLKEARSRLALAQQELQRLESLRRSAAFSQARYDDKREEVTGASHAVSVAQAALSIADSRMSLADVAVRDAVITAPYPGIVTDRHTEVGAFVGRGDPVVSLLNNRDLEVEADIPFDLVGGVTEGGGVTVRLDADTEVTATVRAIVPSENARTRTRPARFALPGGAPRTPVLAAGQSVTVLVPDGPERSVLAVPKDAVINKPTGNMVFVVKDGVAQPRPLDIGAAVGGAFTVLDGLQAGETVVTRGNERLRPGQPVKETVPPSAQGASDAGAGE